MKNNQLKKKSELGSLYAYPMGIWFTLFFLLPFTIIVIYSFLRKALYGGVELHFTLIAYKQIFQKAYGLILSRTLLISLEATVITLLIAIPCALALARSKYQTLFLSFIIIPFLINSLLKIFALMSIFSSDGVINRMLLGIGLIDKSISFLYNRNAVILLMVYMYLPYAIFPIFASIDSFDFTLLDAARDLGYNKFQSYIHVLLPEIKEGITTAFLFTFIPAFGAYTIPLFVGGKDSYMIGNLIVDQINKTRNWPLSSAFSVLLTIISTALVLYFFVDEKKNKNHHSHKGGKNGIY